jgi:1,4-dihydroxy-2-naphthoyl-CoA hydrolase
MEAKCRVGRVELTLEQLKAAGSLGFPGFVGVEVDEVSDGRVTARLPLRDEHLAPNGYLHAGVVITLADTACGYGCILSLPEGGTGFTTIELKTNFLRTAPSGTISCEATRVHGGRTTQLWDAAVRDDAGRTMALFRCTQLVLYDG